MFLLLISIVYASDLNCCVENFPCCVVYNAEQAAQQGGEWGCWGSGMCSNEHPQGIDNWAGKGYDCRITKCGDDHCCAYSLTGTCLVCENTGGYFMNDGKCINTLDGLKYSQVSENVLYVTSSDTYNQFKSDYQAGKQQTLVKAIARTISSTYDADYIYVFPKEKISPGQSQQFLDISNSGNLKGAITSNGHTSGFTATLHEIGHEWLVHIGEILPNFYSCGAHWGFTMLDMKGMLGGFAPEGVKCSNGKTPTPSSPCAAEGVATTLTFDANQGSTRTSNDFANPTFSKIELGLMGLYSADEVASYNLYYCDVGSDHSCFDEDVVSWDSNTKLFKVQCQSTIWFNAKDILENPAFDSSEQISPGTKLKVMFAQVFDSNPPTSQGELESGDAYDVSRWIHGYADNWPKMWSDATEGRSSVSLTVTLKDPSKAIATTTTTTATTTTTTTAAPSGSCDPKFLDSDGDGCTTYKNQGWCGQGWLSHYANSKGQTAAVCPQCGCVESEEAAVARRSRNSRPTNREAVTKNADTGRTRKGGRREEDGTGSETKLGREKERLMKANRALLNALKALN